MVNSSIIIYKENSSVKKNSPQNSEFTPLSGFRILWKCVKLVDKYFGDKKAVTVSENEALFETKNNDVPIVPETEWHRS